MVHFQENTSIQKIYTNYQDKTNPIGGNNSKSSINSKRQRIDDDDDDDFESNNIATSINCIIKFYL